MRSLESIDDARVLSHVRNLGLAIAAAGATVDGQLSKVLFQLQDVGPTINILIGAARIPLHLDLLLGAGEIEELDGLRREAFDDTFNDEALELATVAAQAAGAEGWLDRYLAQLIAAEAPGGLARAMTISAFRGGPLLMDLSNGPDLGFLAEISRRAQQERQAGELARHWLTAAWTAQTPTDFWRFAQLAEGVAGRSVLIEIEKLDGTSLLPELRPYGAEMLERLRKAAENRIAKRKETLFGLKAPMRDLVVTLSDQPDA
jgi:hypothetical protein